MNNKKKKKKLNMCPFCCIHFLLFVILPFYFIIITQVSLFPLVDLKDKQYVDFHFEMGPTLTLQKLLGKDL